MEFCINDIMAQIKLCLQGIIAGNKRVQLENEIFTITIYGTVFHNIRIDIKENIDANKKNSN